MKIRGFAILGTGMLAAALAAAACQSNSSNSPSTGGTGGTGTGGTGTGGTATGGSAGTGSGGSAGNGGSAGSPTDGGNCTYTQTTTVQDLNANTIAAKTYVQVKGVVATSQKFLVSQSKSTGSCLWGVFVSAPNVPTATAGTGLMLISYGPNVTTTEAGTVGKCQSGADGIPDNVQPGDTFDVIGAVSPYAPSTCTGTAPQMQLRVPTTCPIKKTGTTTPPAPATLTTAIADQLAAGTDTSVANKWGGVLMTLSNVDATVPDGGTTIVQKYGVITFQQTALQGHDTLFYDDLSGAGPKDSSKAWQYATATHFNHMTGIIYLDYCTWSLNPRNKCTDVDPASDDCPGG